MTPREVACAHHVCYFRRSDVGISGGREEGRHWHPSSFRLTVRITVVFRHTPAVEAPSSIGPAKASVRSSFTGKALDVI
jgi:hypothetical protein